MSRRTEKMASLIRQVLSEAITTRLSDPRISSFASITRVEVSGDVMHASVYVSVMGDEVQEQLTMAGLRHARGHLQTLLARSLSTRHCPQLRFVADKGLKKQMQILGKLEQISAELREVDAARQAQAESQTGAGLSNEVEGPAESEDAESPLGEAP
jgi:ribosome-binding factor A